MGTAGIVPRIGSRGQRRNSRRSRVSEGLRSASNLEIGDEGSTMTTDDVVCYERAGSQSSQAGGVRALQQLIEEFLTEALGFAPGVVVPTARFTADYGMSSLDLLELAIDAQERFGAEISDEALARVETVGDFGRCVVEAVGRRGRGGHQAWYAGVGPAVR